MKCGFFMMQVFLNAVRYGLLFILSLVLIVVGAIWSAVCLYIGLGLLLLYLLLCFASAIQNSRTVKRLSEENPEMQTMLDQLMTDPNAFLSDITGEYDEKKKLHGQELLTLSDDDLFETVYFQNLDIAESAEEEEQELEQFSGARRTVYILGLYDMELQNGGLCQFFVNSSKAVAPYVEEALDAVGAAEHHALLKNFIGANQIDLSDLRVFRASGVRKYRKLEKKYDFDAFDEQYYELPPLQKKVVAYIKEHIDEF